MNIGYVGLGNMGGPLAERLMLQYKLAVYDLSQSAMEVMAEGGATACGSLAELAAQCQTIFMCLPTSDHVRSALFGENGLAARVRPGTLIVDQTTGDPKATHAMAVEIAKLGAELIDAPVSGGASGAKAGTIAIMVGASPEQFARVQPTLAVISPNIFHAGGVGAGHAMKLVNNALSGAQRLLTMEAVALAAKSGIDPATACSILTAGGARNAFLERNMGPNVVQGRLAVGFSLGLMHKDMRLACQLGLDLGVPMLLSNVARELYLICMNENGATAEVNTAALVIDRMAGTKVVPQAIA